MSGKQAKANRQIGKALMEEFRPLMDARIDEFEGYVKERLEAQQKLNKNIHSWLIQEVKIRIQNDLFNANLTLDAVVAVLAEAGLNIPEFDKKIDAKKVELAAIRKQQAEAQMQAEREAREAEAAAKSAESQPQPSPQT